MDGNVDLLICIFHHIKEILASLLCSSPLASPILTIHKLSLKLRLPENQCDFRVGDKIYTELIENKSFGRICCCDYKVH